VPDGSHPGEPAPHADQPGPSGLDWLESQLGAGSGEPTDESSDVESGDGEPDQTDGPVLPPEPTESVAPSSVAPASVAPASTAPFAAEHPSGTAPDVAVPGPDAAAPAPDAALTGATPDSEPPTRRIRDEIELEPAPWWTTPVQKPLIRTEEETRLLPSSATDEELPPTAEPSTVAGPADGVDGSRNGRTSSHSKRMLMWVGAGVLAVGILVGLFFLGQQLGGSSAPVPAPISTQAKTPTPTPTPTATVQAVGPLPVGVHKWNELGGGECLQPYGSPWAEEFTVVDCAAPHPAQLVYRGVFAGDAATTFPGEAALAAQINLLCSAPGVIDLNAAGGYPDLQLQGSYPVTEEQWTSGPRNYYCFLSRSSGEPLTASIAGPGPAPAG
jgi:hypothetical protein